MSYCQSCSNNLDLCSCPLNICEPINDVALEIDNNIISLQQPQYVLPSNDLTVFDEIELLEKYDPPAAAKLLEEVLRIPKLERHTNKPGNWSLSDEDLKGLAVELFPEEKELVSDADFTQLLQNANDDHVDFDYIFDVNECNGCGQFVCVCDQILQCSMPGCNNSYYYNDSHPAYDKMCFICEMKARKQELIDLQNCPEDNVGYF